MRLTRQYVRPCRPYDVAPCVALLATRYTASTGQSSLPWAAYPAAGELGRNWVCCSWDRQRGMRRLVGSRQGHRIIAIRELTKQNERSYPGQHVRKLLHEVLELALERRCVFDEVEDLECEQRAVVKDLPQVPAQMWAG